MLAVGEAALRSELEEALKEVRLLVEIARGLGHVGEVTLGALVPELLLARSPRLAALARRRALGPLTEYSGRLGRDFLGTMETLFACGLNRRETAERLHLHPNTLGYRLRRIQEITGLRLDRADDLLLVGLALKSRSLTPGKDAPPAS
ncbi:MAG: helix-turn-helix domain-containing protein [Acidobacteria bacterium]|nr:helix-turn-helix domain-containing protein [Acidobacteriota bacterium]